MQALRRRLVIMVKAPVAGRVKTRLGRDIGMVRAAWWFRHHLAKTIRSLHDPRWQTLLAVTPDTALASSCLPPLPRIPQGAGDLGARMGGIFHSLPPGPALIIGADIPGITCAHIAYGFKALGSHDAAIGPAPDGGYWAIGLKRTRAVPAKLFEGVRWSTPHARNDTLATLSGFSVATLPVLADVDTGSDLVRLSR
jgi:hypothetical protein